MEVFVILSAFRYDFTCNLFIAGVVIMIDLYTLMQFRGIID